MQRENTAPSALQCSSAIMGSNVRLHSSEMNPSPTTLPSFYHKCAACAVSLVTPTLEYSLLALGIVALYYVSRYSFLLFHAIAELFSVIIGYCVFLVVFHTRHIAKNSLLVAVGSVYGFVATLDLFHMLAYKGMEVFPPKQDPSIQLWVAARYLECVMVLVATVMHRKLSGDTRWLYGFIAAQAVLTILAFLTIFEWKVFPVCYDDSKGVLTPFKKGSEYAFCVIWFVAGVYLLCLRPHSRPVAWAAERAQRFMLRFFPVGSSGVGYFNPAGTEAGVCENLPDHVRCNMVVSFLFCIATEIVLTFYVGMGTWYSIVGHSFKVMSFYLVYKALVRATLTEPYTTLFNDLLRVNADLSRATEIAETALKQRSEVMAWMSHEIRTPLNGIIGMVELLHSTGMSDEQLRVVNVMEGASSNLLVIINDILDFFKLEAGKMTLELIPTDLADLAQSVMALYQPKMAERGVNPVVVLPPELPRLLLCDPTRVRQVLSNLVSNSVKFTRHGSVRLEIGITQEAVMDPTGVNTQSVALSVEFSVRDTGIGIPAEQQRDLFSPFSQIHASTARLYGGTGLGLAIVRQLVELMGGTLRMTSVEGEGSTFSFTLLLEAHNTEHLEAAPQDAVVLAPLLGVRLLVVDDNAINRAVMQSFATRLGCGVEFAVDGLQAVRFFGEKHPLAVLETVDSTPPLTSIPSGNPLSPHTKTSTTTLAEVVTGPGAPVVDIVFMDISMPVMNGIEATRRIRALGVTVPIIGLTADITRETREASLEADMNEVMLKPVKLRDFVECIHRWVPGCRSTTC